MRAINSKILSLWLAAAMLISFFGGPVLGATDAGLDRKAAGLACENELLRRQVELASGREFYLILSPAQGELSLMLEGVVLRKYEVQEIRLGRPRVWFRTKPEPPGWKELTYERGRLSPSRSYERMEMVAPGRGASGDSVAPVIPPLPEEAVPAPRRFSIIYRNGLALDIESGAPEEGPGWLENLGRLGARLSDKMRAFFHLDRGALRIQITMKPEDAATLYRSVPPDTKLLVLSSPEQ